MGSQYCMWEYKRSYVLSFKIWNQKATADPYIIKTKNDFISEIHRLNAIDNITDTNLEVSIDNEGNYVIDIVDKSLDADLIILPTHAVYHNLN
ncbi:unknown [Clostridium sp. CAG:678]|nr:unknown [Clostridium sp. CAG:678]